MAATIIFATVVLIIVFFRWFLARLDGFTFWTNRPLIGWDAYYARRDAAVAQERDDALAVLDARAALTPEDVEGLVALGWDPPEDVTTRLAARTQGLVIGTEVITRIGPVTLGVRAATPAELRFDPYADGSLKRPMSLVGRDGAV